MARVLVNDINDEYALDYFAYVTVARMDISLVNLVACKLLGADDDHVLADPPSREGAHEGLGAKGPRKVPTVRFMKVPFEVLPKMLALTGTEVDRVTRKISNTQTVST